MDAIKTAKVWIGERKGITSPIHVSQYDTAWTFQFKVYKDDLIYEPENTVSVIFTGKKSDDTVFAVPADFEDGVATVVSTVAMTAAAGIVECELRFSADGETVGTANFDMVVEPSPVEGGTPSESDFTTLQTMLDDMSEMYAETVDNAAAAESAASTAAMEVLSEAPEMVYDWLEANVTPETGYVIDSGLTIQGAAADAKATGDAIVALNASVVSEIARRVDGFLSPEVLSATWEQGTISSASGSPTDSTTRIRTGYIPMETANKILVNVPTGYKLTVYTFSTNAVSGFIGQAVLWGTGTVEIPVTPDYYFRLVAAKTNDSAILPAAGADIIISRYWPADATLSLEHKPADAKAVGDMFGTSLRVVSYDGDTLLKNQTTNTICRISNRTDIVDAPEGFNLTRYYWLFTIGGLNKMQFLFYSGDSCIYYRFLVYSRDWTDWYITGPAGDNKKPVYVAFGASTTVGAVHHYEGTNVTYSDYAFPEYVGQALALDAHNLGQGTTGFMARDAGKKPNFMDSIYNNSELLSDAALVTLMFGYGNDRVAGLPIGEWDDYFPYDEVGAFYVSGNTSANESGIQTMLAAGATLMGCLNWCIKWIGEKYPKAQLVLICGAPSGNSDKTIVIGTNPASGAGTAGVAPKKLTVTSVTPALSQAVAELKEAINIPVIDLFTDMLPFSYYQTYATEEDGSYAVFSTKGTVEAPVWNSHPNDDGYLMYARYLAGRIAEYFRH